MEDREESPESLRLRAYVVCSVGGGGGSSTMKAFVKFWPVLRLLTAAKPSMPRWPFVDAFLRSSASSCSSSLRMIRMLVIYGPGSDDD